MKLKNILVKTHTNDNGNFDVYTDYENIEITPNGQIFEMNGTDRGAELQLKTLGLQVDAISSIEKKLGIRTQDINVDGNMRRFL